MKLYGKSDIIMRYSCVALCFMLAGVVFGQNTYLVAPQDGDDSWDGQSPSHQGGLVGPMKTISAAYGACATGDVIELLPGVYDDASQGAGGTWGILIDRSGVDVVIQSHAGSSVTIEPSTVSAIHVSSPDASLVLKDVTVKPRGSKYGIYHDREAAGRLILDGVTVEPCSVFTLYADGTERLEIKNRSVIKGLGNTVVQLSGDVQHLVIADSEVIDEAGYGPYFIHRTGHGLGLEVHEPPFIIEGSTAPLPVGAVFTVEPGAYLPGRGGVRIEDNLVMTAEGYRCLTTFPRALMVLDKQ